MLLSSISKRNNSQAKFLSKVGTSFHMSRMSSTYRTRKTTTLPLALTYSHDLSSLLKKLNSLTSPLKQRFQLQDVCLIL